MAGCTVILRNANKSDAAAMAHVEQQSWPPELAADEDLFRIRVRTYPEGQWVIEHHRLIVGVATAQRITTTCLADRGDTYAGVTDHGRFHRSHDPFGEIYQLVGVGVLPDHRGLQLGRQLVDRQIDFARSVVGIERIVGFTRPAGYHVRSDLSIQEYVRSGTDEEAPIDPVLAFHLKAGARVVSIHANFRPEDRQAAGYGVLIEYPTRLSLI